MNVVFSYILHVSQHSVVNFIHARFLFYYDTSMFGVIIIYTLDSFFHINKIKWKLFLQKIVLK